MTSPSIIHSHISIKMLYDYLKFWYFLALLQPFSVTETTMAITIYVILVNWGFMSFGLFLHSILCLELYTSICPPNVWFQSTLFKDYTNTIQFQVVEKTRLQNVILVEIQTKIMKKDNLETFVSIYYNKFKCFIHWLVLLSWCFLQQGKRNLDTFVSVYCNKFLDVVFIDSFYFFYASYNKI